MLPASTPAEERRARQLAIGRRRATGMLVVVAVIFALSTIFLSQARWLAWVQATSIASLVGGLADWFAVTALFRRPLGLPIPHTAIVVERKDRFGETLGSFVQESFLTPAAVSARLRSSRAIERTAAWLAKPENADELAGRITDGLVDAADLLRDEDVHGVLDALVRERVDKIALAPLAGRTLRQLTRDGRHNPVIDASLQGLSRYLRDHGPDLHQRLGVESPWWLPDAVQDRLFDRLLLRTIHVVDDMARNPNHPLRHQVEVGLVKLAEELQTSEEMRKRGEELKVDLLGQPQIRRFAQAVWRDTKDQLRSQSSQPGSELRTRLSSLIVQTGERLRDDPQLAESAQRSLDAIAKLVLGTFDVELASLVSSTIGRWDASETSRRLELLLGPDLQYIRINGTVVGGLAGLALHAISQAVG